MPTCKLRCIHQYWFWAQWVASSVSILATSHRRVSAPEDVQAYKEHGGGISSKLWKSVSPHVLFSHHIHLDRCRVIRYRVVDGNYSIYFAIKYTGNHGFIAL